MTVGPGARRNEISWARDGTLTVRVTAPPIEGRANRALCNYLASVLGVAPSRVMLARGAGSHHKLVEVDGITLADVLAKLGR